MKHKLKTLQPFFEAVRLGKKRFEVRKNDRGYEEGDTLELIECREQDSEPTGRAITCVVDYVLDGGRFGVETGYVVMSICAIEEVTT